MQGSVANAPASGRLLAMLVVVASGLAVAWLLFWPLEPKPAKETNRAPVRETSGEEANFARSAVADVDWQRRLRRWEPVVVQTKPQAVRKKSNLKIRLVGTIIEGRNSYAIFEDSSRKMDTQPTGGVLRLQPDGVRVERIDPDKVAVSFNGAVEILELTSPEIFDAGSNDGMSQVDARESQDLAESVSAQPDSSETMMSDKTNEKTMNWEEAADEFETIDDENDFLNGNPPPAPRGKSNVDGDEQQ